MAQVLSFLRLPSWGAFSAGDYGLLVFVFFGGGREGGGGGLPSFILLANSRRVSSMSSKPSGGGLRFRLVRIGGMAVSPRVLFFILFSFSFSKRVDGGG